MSVEPFQAYAWAPHAWGMAATRPAEEDPDRFLDDLFARLRAEGDPAVRDRVAHGLAPADRPTDELARMMAAPLPRRSAWDDMVGPFHDTPGVARLLDVSRQALQAQRQRGRLLALRTGDGQWPSPPAKPRSPDWSSSAQST